MKTMFGRPVRALLVPILAALLIAADAPPSRFVLTPDMEAALDTVSADSLRGHLSFIASDLLEGRATPSPGLDIAAEYIAAQFRRAGLEPVGDDAYFQTAHWRAMQRNMSAFSLIIKAGEADLKFAEQQVSISAARGLALNKAPVIKVAFDDSAGLAALAAEDVAGRVVLTELPDLRRADRSRLGETFRARNAFLDGLARLKPAILISIDRVGTTGTGEGPVGLIDPRNPRPTGQTTPVPLITVHSAEAAKLYDGFESIKPLEVSLSLPEPEEKPVKLRNVVGLLRGSDPELKDTYILVTAHYDHVGRRPSDGDDDIFNGANDDGSGTVTVIELASALSRLKPRPRRSIVFMAVFGEERGLLGSRYYGRNPIFSLSKTVANINLEQVGRTDSTEGPQVARASVTGFDYSDLGEILKAAGEMTAVEVYKHPTNSDAYFSRSDNRALADQGVPSHTLCVAFNYPDYHGAGDHWDKIDYDNMAKIARTVGVGLLMIASRAEAPRWNKSNPRAARYIKAWEERQNVRTSER